ncbi:hypothetical protein [Ectothiorhodospira sp. PHS-1]|uniref:hypothetical protein n=1 Tax=Ectothiorhodospira sp. PHS-1 TaxID=519989 RepID=UPI001145CA91|nr:hypothetical protein [Ectothiorhodospira sp. PHS-1]
MRWVVSRRLVALTCLLWVGVVLFPTAVAGPQVVVANDSITQNALPLATVRAIFSLRVQSLDGHKLTVFVLDPRGPVHAAFSKDVLGVFPYQLESAWNRSIFSGTSRGPVVVNSEAEMRHRVANTVGGIGYLSPPVIDEGIRILNIEGSQP